MLTSNFWSDRLGGAAEADGTESLARAPPSKDSACLVSVRSRVLTGLSSVGFLFLFVPPFGVEAFDLTTNFDGDRGWTSLSSNPSL